MFPVIDMHCDTISVIHDAGLAGKELSLRENTRQIDLQRLKKGGYMCQNFALFTYMGNWMDIPSMYQTAGVKEKYAAPIDYCLALSDLFDREIAQNADIIRPALSAGDIERNFSEGFISALKTVEEGAVYEGGTDNLKLLYDRGVRMTTLTWNFENELAYPNYINLETGETKPDTERHLKKAGRELVEACADLGMIVDVSHLNDAGIYDIFDILGSKTPFVASHSNARAVTGQARNLPDDLLRRFGECGGVVGINFCADFANDRGDNLTKISDLLSHIDHMVNTAGIEAVGLGTDFDGIENEVETGGCEGMQILAEALLKAGYTEEDVEKIFYKNVLRVYREVL